MAGLPPALSVQEHCYSPSPPLEGILVFGRATPSIERPGALLTPSPPLEGILVSGRATPSIERPGALLLPPPEGDVSPSQGYPQH